jgi:hypothetical protein
VQQHAAVEGEESSQEEFLIILLTRLMEITDMNFPLINEKFKQTINFHYRRVNTHCTDKAVQPVCYSIGNIRNIFALHEYTLQQEVLVVYIFYIVSLCTYAQTLDRGTNKQNVLNILYLSCPFFKFVVPEALNFVGEFNAINDTFLGTVCWYVIRRERFHKGLHYPGNIPDFQKELREKKNRNICNM